MSPGHCFLFARGKSVHPAREYKLLDIDRNALGLIKSSLFNEIEGGVQT